MLRPFRRISRHQLTGGKGLPTGGGGRQPDQAVTELHERSRQSTPQLTGEHASLAMRGERTVPVDGELEYRFRCHVPTSANVFTLIKISDAHACFTLQPVAVTSHCRPLQHSGGAAQAGPRLTAIIITWFDSGTPFFAGFGVLHHLQDSARLDTIAGELT